MDDGMQLAGMMAIGLVMGCLAGCVPLFYGAMHDGMRKGIFGFLACAAGGAVLGMLLALPLSALFTYQIARAKD